ncbi:portal protein [Brevundimonas diminuta]|uniref:portal protein n=1 Tax=Brevundimonas diminuta TaxID=293 RepID=UPI003D9A90A7
MALPSELQQRISACRTDRAKHQNAINDFLRLADPVRPRIGDSGATVRSDEADDLYDPMLQEVAEDFASDTLHRIMPRESDWLKYEPEKVLPDEVQKQLAEPLKHRTDAIFSAVRQSNFYGEAGAEWAFDLGHGTAALICNDHGKGEPLSFEAIGPHQLLIERGARGRLSAQGREFQLPLEEAFAQWPGAEWPGKLRRRLNSRASRRALVTCIEMATRVYDPGDEKWKWHVAVDNDLIDEDDLTGSGSCPVVVTRWRSISSTAWGIGPLRKALADAKSLDQVAYLRLKNLGRQVDPVTVYDDDGVLNPEGGIGAGMWLPRLPGSKIDQLDAGQIEVAYYEQGKLQDAVRRAGFQSGPRQEGKTPPTAFQWREQQVEEGRRLEQPTGKLYEEGVIAILNRVEFLLTQRGTIEPMVQAGKQAIRVRPLSPLAKQQDSEKLSNAANLLNIARSVFDPQTMAATVDMQATFENMVQAADDEIIVVRSKDQADQYMRGVIGQPGMAPGLETAPGEAPQ